MVAAKVRYVCLDLFKVAFFMVVGLLFLLFCVIYLVSSNLVFFYSGDEGVEFFALSMGVVGIFLSFGMLVSLAVIGGCWLWVVIRILHWCAVSHVGYFRNGGFGWILRCFEFV